MYFKCSRSLIYDLKTCQDVFDKEFDLPEYYWRLKLGGLVF